MENIKRFGDLKDVFGSGEMAFPDVEDTKELEEVLNMDILFEDVAFRTSAQYEGSEFAIVKACIPIDEDNPFTFTVGGKVVVQKLKKAKEMKLLPLLGKIIHIKGKNGRKYFDIE